MSYNKFEGPDQIEIRRIPRPGYFGITAFGNTCTRLGAPITERGYKTGLTEEEERYFEKELKLKEGELNRHSKWWSDVFNVDYSIRLNNAKVTKIILDNPINQIRYKVLLACEKVANSELEKTPDAEFYIDNRELKAKVENEKFDYELEGMERIFKMSPDEKRTALRLFGKTGLEELSESMLKQALGHEIKRDAKKFVNTLNDADANMKAWIFELVEKNLIKRDKNGFKYGDDSLGSNLEACVDYFKNPVHQDIKLILASNLEKVKKGKKVKEIKESN